MRILPPQSFQTQPWKNGGGVTHEIARADREGRLLWRLSIAEVASDGPFSAFPGLTRILTVIGGAGLWLDTPEGRLSALPGAPLRFSGDLPVMGRRIDGPVRDFNLIWDASALTAEVTRCDGAVPACPARPGGLYAFLSLGPSHALFGPDLPGGGAALFEQFNAIEAQEVQGFLVTMEQID